MSWFEIEWRARASPIEFWMVMRNYPARWTTREEAQARANEYGRRDKYSDREFRVVERHEGALRDVLELTFRNDRTGADEAANYDVRVYLNNREIHRERIDGHPRSSGWLTLVRRLVSADGTLDTLYCGIELAGGWCKRSKGHQGDHACS